ncbi:hypothetical protein PAECIP111892_02252 [Paenibacillus auburnensis]|uniref:DUF4179 domain-containing protein n=1 Tax=Paenibacillus auburnensis TaxID=2905649 RepID=A0ABM9BY59_9BACL|nr:DUF4179 domain-containing protein [Paenibacillus auburnensis]CAH1196505.1 hypothetical protein PAECIP111892_02252 [Paenibacillus auburnensis]
MKKLENMLKHQLNEEIAVNYPDFDSMWGRVEQATNTVPLKTDAAGGAGSYRVKNWRRVMVAASLSALLAAAPVYAAIQYDWGNLLRDREGVQAALDQNLGQQLGQSISRDGVTLTLRTAIVDENRTVILYSLDVGKRADQEFWNVKGLSLKDEKGNSSEGEYSYQQWDEKNQRYNGYFESDWTSKSEEAKVTLTAAAVQSFTQTEQELSLDSGSSALQTFQIGQEGMQSLEVQPFTQSDGKLLLSSAVIYDNPQAKEWTYPQIVAYKGGKLVNSIPGTFGAPGDNGEYTMKQYFKTAEVPEGQTAYKLQYTKLEQNITGPWSFDLQLSKQQMESGTIKTALNLPLEPGDTVNTIESMVVTPTQIRVSVKVKNKNYSQIPYHKVELEVGGKTLEGLYYSTRNDPSLSTFSFERPGDLVIGKQTPVTFVGRYKVTLHGDDKTPLQLTNISADKQTLIRDTGGYPVKWTYYMQGSDLFVETQSDDARFGGVNQTHINLGKDRILGKPVTTNFTGDGNNKAIDVYKNFKGTEASIYMFFYTTDEPEKETRVQLQP